MEVRTLSRQWELPLRGDTPLGIVVDPGKPCLYVAAKQGGLVVVGLPGRSAAPTVRARVPKQLLGGLDAMHATWSDGCLTVALGDHFAARGSRAGLALVDVADPDAPRVRGLWTSSETLGGASMALADRGTVFLAAMHHGVVVLDVADPARIRRVGGIRPDPDFPLPHPNRVHRPNARGLALRGDRLFVAYDAGGLRILDIARREAPVEIGRYVNSGMGKRQQAFNHVALDGDRLFASVDYAGLEVLDVAHPDAIRRIGWWNPWRADSAANHWFDSPGHANALVLDPAAGTVTLAAGDSELQVVDVRDPERPALAARYGRPKDGRGAWGVAVATDTAYLTCIPAVVPFRSTWSGIVAVRR